MSIVNSQEDPIPLDVESSSSSTSRLIDQVHEQIRYLDYSTRTEQAYVYWIKAFINFHDLRHPVEMRAVEVEAFLAWLASERKVAVATHKQALSALVFLYQKVLGVDLPRLAEIGRAKGRVRPPVVLTHDEVSRLLLALEGVEYRLLGQRLYCTGMRIMEGIRLRVKDCKAAMTFARCGSCGAMPT